jgi:glutamate/tyrosine decarboxylase-like PLP-dependent enzyme
MSMDQFLEAAVYAALDMIGCSGYLRMADKGEKMRQRISQEGTSGTDVSMRVPPDSFSACLWLAVASLLEEYGVPVFPLTIGP